jgi:hypothetical protein
MKLLENYVKEFMLERTNLKIKRKVPLDAHLYLIPRLSDNEMELFFKKVVKEIKVDKYQMGKDDWGFEVPNTSQFFVFDKTKENFKKFFKLVNENWPENIDKQSFGFEAKNFIDVFEDNLPVLLVQAGGDFHKYQYAQVNKGVMRVNQENVSDISWAVHDFYHPNEGQFHKTFPSPRGGEGFEWNNGFTPEQRKRMLENCIEFLETEGNTRGVGIDDVYASIWSYIALNIDNEYQIEALPILNNNSKKYFKYYFDLVQKFNKEWLKKYENKILVNYNV